MQNLTLADLRVGLRDLFERRAGALAKLGASKVYDPLLRRQLDAIEKLPGAPADHAARLGEADALHDGFAQALWHLTEAYLRAPSTSAETRAALARVRDAFVPSLAVTAAPYAEEAAAAQDRAAQRDALAADLRAVPLANGATLYDWADGYVMAGAALDALLQRAELPPRARAEAGKVRAVTLGILSRFRAAVRDEVSASPALDAAVEAEVFAHFDQLDAERGRT